MELLLLTSTAETMELASASSVDMLSIDMSMCISEALMLPLESASTSLKSSYSSFLSKSVSFVPLSSFQALRVNAPSICDSLSSHLLS
jgi:hypothetical protein